VHEPAGLSAVLYMYRVVHEKWSTLHSRSVCCLRHSFTFHTEDNKVATFPGKPGNPDKSQGIHRLSGGKSGGEQKLGAPSREKSRDFFCLEKFVLFQRLLMRSFILFG